MATVATFKDFIKVREYIYLKYDYYAKLGQMRDNLSPEEELLCDGTSQGEYAPVMEVTVVSVE